MPVYYGRHRDPYVLKDTPVAGGTGGEGSVYEIEGNANLVAKLYHAKKFTSLPNGGDSRQYLYEKLLTMLDQPVNPYVGSGVSQALTVAWPQDILMDSQGVFVGYIMPRVNSRYHIYDASRERERKMLYPHYTWKTAVVIAYNLALAVKIVHSTNAVIGDFNTNNIMLDHLGHVTLIDTDSFNITNQRTGKVYKCTVGVAENLPPELQGKNLAASTSIFTQQTDNFALAIHIFSLLMNNCHPFSCSSMNQLQSSASGNPAARNIVRGDCPYVSNGRGTRAADAPDIMLLPPELQQLFERAFAYDVYTAVQAATIARRPSAEEWFNALQRLVKTKFAVCSNPSHVYPPHNRMCPWCALEQRKKGQLTVHSNPIPQQPGPGQQPTLVQRPAAPQPAIDMSHFQLDAGGRTLIKYVGPGGDVVVPPGVTHIKECAFSPYSSYRDKELQRIQKYLYGGTAQPPQKAIKSIVLPQGVTAIGESAFADCTGLQRVVLPHGIRSIGAGAFQGCSSLQSISIPQGITQIDEDTFWGCESLQNVIIPPGVTRIGRSAFFGCKNLRQITIPPSTVWIGGGAFRNCSSLQRADVAPGTIIFEDAFAGCSSLLTRPGGEMETAGTDLSHFKFDEGCHVLKKYVGPGGDVIIPKGVAMIGDGAFSNCSSLRSVTIPTGLVWIGNSAFSDCSNLQSVTMPDEITYLGEDAFSRCSSLRHVTIPQGIETIIQSAFFGCSSLESVTIPNGVTEIGKGAFQCCYKLKSITIPQGVKEIALHAFANCFDLQSVTLPASVTKIGHEAFWRHKKRTWLIHPLTIYAPAGSYAQKYASKNGLRFRSI